MLKHIKTRSCPLEKGLECHLLNGETFSVHESRNLNLLPVESTSVQSGVRL